MEYQKRYYKLHGLDDSLNSKRMNVILIDAANATYHIPDTPNTLRSVSFINSTRERSWATHWMYLQEHNGSEMASNEKKKQKNETIFFPV